MSFKDLLAELNQEQETLAKAMAPAGDGEGEEGDGDGEGDDAAIQAAADEGGEGGAGADAGNADDGEDEGDDLVKALGLKPTKVTVAGKDVEAFDGTVLVKSLIAQNTALSGQMSEAEQVMKSLAGMNKALIKQVTELRKSVDALAGQPRGRRSAVVTLPDGGQPPKQEAIKPDQFMAKCLDAMRAGKINAGEVAEANAFVNSGLAPSESLIAKVMG